VTGDEGMKMEEGAAISRSMTKKSRPNVLELEGEIDLHVSQEVAESLRPMIASKPKILVVDLAKVTYIDSSGLAVLIDAMQHVQQYGGKFAIGGAQESVRHIFEIARLDQVFQIYPDADSALATE
jgi:anti-sigma B factor antagonist